MSKEDSPTNKCMNIGLSVILPVKMIYVPEIYYSWLVYTTIGICSLCTEIY